MITAQEARDLIASSEETVKFYMTKIEPIVRKAAAAGKHSAFLYVTDLWEALDAFEQRRAEPSLSQAAVMKKLVELGYGVVFAADNDPAATYVPLGLADDEGNGPVHTNFGITVRW